MLINQLMHFVIWRMSLHQPIFMYLLNLHLMGCIGTDKPIKSLTDNIPRQTDDLHELYFRYDSGIRPQRLRKSSGKSQF